MAKTRLQMTDEAAAEIEQRALYLLKLYGVQDHDSPQLWRKHSVVYEVYPLMISSDEYQLNVRFSEPPDPSGFHTYTSAFQKMKETGHVDTFPRVGRLALDHMRRLMLLDDLASVADAPSPRPDGLADV